MKLSDKRIEELFNTYSIQGILTLNQFKAALSELTEQQEPREQTYYKEVEKDIAFLERMNLLIEWLLANEHDHSKTEELSVMIKDWIGELKSLKSKKIEGEKEKLSDTKEELRITKKYLSECKNKYDMVKGELGQLKGEKQVTEEAAKTFISNRFDEYELHSKDHNDKLITKKELTQFRNIAVKAIHELIYKTEK